MRIRGSAFYRNPEREMQGVFSTLQEMGISPTSNTTEAPVNDMTLVHELTARIEEDRRSNELRLADLFRGEDLVSMLTHL